MAAGEDSTEAKYFTLAEMCDNYVLCILDRCGGNRVAAAQVLGIGRTTIYRHLKRLGFDRESVQPGIHFKANYNWK